MCIGIPHIGSSGFIVGFLHIPWAQQQWWLMLMNIIFALAWIVYAAFAIVILVLLVVHSRKDNASGSAAKGQLFGMAAKRSLAAAI